jgi:hypothetical protein
MKIGIFGDSFASPNKLNPSRTWVEILNEKYDIVNHAVTGSNLYYSVTEVKKYYTSYDKIILIVTQPSRLQVPEHIPLIGEDRFIQPWVLEVPVKLDANTLQKLVWQAGKQYYSYLQDTTYDEYIHNLMLKDIKETVPNIILVPAFLNSWTNVDSAIVQITLKENKSWNLDWDYIIENLKDIRNCHMTEESHTIFAMHVEKWLNNEPVHINLDDFVTTTNKDFYLKQR